MQKRFNKLFSQGYDSKLIHSTIDYCPLCLLLLFISLNNCNYNLFNNASTVICEFVVGINIFLYQFKTLYRFWYSISIFYSWKQCLCIYVLDIVLDWTKYLVFCLKWQSFKGVAEASFDVFPTQVIHTRDKLHFMKLDSCKNCNAIQCTLFSFRPPCIFLLLKE